MFGETAAKQAFAFLESESGFNLERFEYSAAHFGNFIAEYARDGVKITVARDRNQVFIDLAGPDGTTRDKEDVLESLGVSRERHPTVNGLWTGYDLVHQVRELREHLSRLVQTVRGTI